MPAVSSSDIIRGPLRLGSRGSDVMNLQGLLSEQNQPDPALTIDGVFGMRTDAAVRVFQQRHGLKADGIVGPLTAKALGVTFIFEPPPAPLPRAPGPPPPATASPRATLFAVIASELKKIFNAVDNEILQQDETDDNRTALKLARAFAKSGLNQAFLLLSTGLPDAVDAQISANQSRTAMLLLFSGFNSAATQVQVAGGDAGKIFDIMSELNAVNPEVVNVVRDTLEGGSTLGEAVREVRNLLDPVAQ